VSGVRGPALGLTLIALAVVASWVLQARQYRAVQATDWAAAATHVRAQFAPGDVVRVAPFWADDARAFLPGLPVDVPRRPDLDTLTAHDRVWLIAGDARPNQPSVSDAKAAMPAPLQPQAEAAFGDVTVLRYDIPPSLKPAFVFADALTDAKVRRVYPTQPQRGPEACDLWRDQERAWHCGRFDPYLYIGVRYREMGGEPRRCVFVAPAPDAGWVEVRYPQVPMRGRLRGRFGVSDESVRSERGGAVLFEVQVNDVTRFSGRVEPDDPTYAPFSISTADLQGQRADVTFRVHAADLLDRFPCFEAVVPSDDAP
jgi:hypothetical protein